MIEEVARHHGYGALGRTVPRAATTGGLTTRQLERRTLRRVLMGRGLSEAMPLPFLAPGELSRCGLPDDGITIANPLVAEQSVLRTVAAARAWSGRWPTTGRTATTAWRCSRSVTCSAAAVDPPAELPDEREVARRRRWPAAMPPRPCTWPGP